MTILAQFNDCHCCNDARSLVQKKITMIGLGQIWCSVERLVLLVLLIAVHDLSVVVLLSTHDNLLSGTMKRIRSSRSHRSDCTQEFRFSFLPISTDSSRSGAGAILLDFTNAEDEAQPGVGNSANP